MSNDENLKDLVVRTKEWNKKYEPNQDQLIIRLYGGDNLHKYNLYIDLLDDEKQFCKVSNLYDDTSIYDFVKKFRNAFAEENKEAENNKFCFILEDGTSFKSNIDNDELSKVCTLRSIGINRFSSLKFFISTKKNKKSFK